METYQLQIGKHQLSYDIAGEGQPVLLLAGGPGLAADYLKPLVERIAKYAQVIVLHQRGTGKSQSGFSPSDITVEKTTADITALSKALNIEKWSIVGHSWGAMLAANYAQLASDKVERMAFICSPGLTYNMLNYQSDTLFQRFSGADKAKALELFQAIPIAANPAEAMVNFFKFATPNYFFDPSKATSLIDFLNTDTFSVGIYTALTSDLAKTAFDLSPQKSSIPTLDLFSRQDIFGFEAHFDIHQVYTNLKQVIIEKAGHYPWLEQDEVYKELEDFLKG